jgi:anti-sigma B factor antagonist
MAGPTPDGRRLTCLCRQLRGGWAVAAPTGEVDLLTAPELRAELLAALTAYSPRLVVDLSGVSFMDCRGLSALVAAWRRASDAGGTVCLVGASAYITKMLAITGLDRMFPIHATLDELSGCAGCHDTRAS